MSQSQRTVLIIDDSYEDCELYQRYLRQDKNYQYNFLQARSGQEGLKIYHSCLPDLVLLDYYLPDLEGIDLIAQLQTQSDRSCLPIIIIAERANEKIGIKCLQAGAQDYLVKQELSAEKLLLVIEKTFQKTKLQWQLQQHRQSAEIITTITQQIYQSFSLEQICQTTVKEVKKFLKCDRVTIVQCDLKGNATIVAQSITTSCESLLATEIQNFSLILRKSEQLTPLQSETDLVVPILLEKQLWGLIIAHHFEASKESQVSYLWQTLAIELLQQLTTQIAIAIRQVELAQQSQIELQERQETETNLRDSKQQLRQVLEAAQIGTWDWNIKTGEIQWSSNLEAMFGLEKGQFDGSFETFINSVHPDDRKYVQQSLDSAVTKGADYDIEFRVVYPNGKLRWAQSKGKVFYNATGEPIRMAGIDLDISERTQAEEALRTSEEFKQRILESSKDCIKLLDLEGRLLYMNNGGMDLIEIEDLTPYLDAKWINSWQGEAYAAAQNAIALARAGEVGRFQGFCSTAKGTPKWWDVVIAPIFGHNQQVIQLLVVSRDVTNSKRTEDALRESEVQFRTLADNMSQFAWMTDSTGWIFWYNRRWFEYTGTTLKDMQGWGWQKVHHPEHIERVTEYFKHCLETGERWEDTFPLKGKDGNYRWFLSRAIPVRDELGEIICWFGTNTDIEDSKQTEEALRHSEERYRYLAESIPQLIWTVDSEGKILDVNQRWSEYTGLTLSQAQSQGWEIIIHSDDLPTLSQQWAAALQTQTHYQAEGRMRRADGAYRWHLHQAVPQKDEQGQIIKWFGTATDIESQKQLEVERDRLLQLEQSARLAAEQANRVKDEFLAILSHELRSPLNPILGWTQLMQSPRFDPERIPEGLATIERNAKLQTQLIDDLLDVAKILRGKLALKLACVNLELAIKQAIETVKKAAIAKDISLEIVVKSIVLVSGDFARIQQIIWNLLSNAIKFTPNGGQIEIHLEQIDSQAQITVTDTGKGIKADFLPYLFESFRQEDLSISRKHGGLGLGLSIVRYLVEAHGGEVSADSLGEGQGATFTVKLPLLESEPNLNQNDKFFAEKIDLTGIRILAIDDNPDARTILFLLLNQSGADVKAVGSVKEFWESLQSFQPQLIISDIGMPEVDGYTLIQQLRSLPAERGGKLPAIALTAYAGETEQQKSIAVGFQKHLAKPINSNLLIRAVAELMQNQN